MGEHVPVEEQNVVSEATNRAKLRSAFLAHYEAISRYCHRRLPPADANDAAAQVFAVAWRKIEDMPPGPGTLPWLYTVARHQVNTMRRSSRRLGNLRAKLNGQARHPEPGPEAVIVRNAEQRELLDAMKKLTPQDQEILRLRAYERLTNPEIAEVLGCSVDAAKKRSVRAIKRLRRVSGLPERPSPASRSVAIQEGGDG